MHVADLVRADGRRSELLAVVIANFVPLVGVLAFGWRAATLVTIYWFELAVVAVWALVRALFAGRPSDFERDALLVGVLADRSAALPLPLTGVGIQLSTLPVLVVLGPMLGLIWFVTGAVTVGPLGDRALDPALVETVTYAALAIFCIEGGRTALEYFYRGGYREHSAQAAIQPSFIRCCALFFVGMGASFVAAIADPAITRDESLSGVDPSIAGVTLLVSIVLVKFGFDLVGVYRDRLVALGESYGLSLEGTEGPQTPDDVDIDLTNSSRGFQPPVVGRLLATAPHLRRFPGAWLIGAFPALFALLFAVSGTWSVAAGLSIAAGTVPLLLLHLDYWLRYGGVEYRVDADAIVASDRLFRSPLWRIEAWDESGVRAERDWFDERLGTTTVVVELPDRTVRLPRLREPEPVLAVFDRPADGVAVE